VSRVSHCIERALLFIAMAQIKTYAEKLQDPRWQKKRLDIMNRDKWRCFWCYNEKEQLHVHHIKYLPGREPWDYPDEMLITLCKSCHEHGNSISKFILLTIQFLFKS